MPDCKKCTRRSLHVLVVTLFMTLFLAACEQEAPIEKEVIRPIRAMQLSDGAEINTRSFPGKAKATQEVELSFRVSGPLITLPVNVGDRVLKGDVLSKIDPRDFDVSLNNIKGQLNKAQANVKRAQSEYGRELRILKQDPGATSQVAVDRKQAQRDQARADITSLSASVAAAKDQLAYTQLYAPFDGVVVETYVDNFESVKAGQQIVRVIDDSKVEMVVNIPEDLISLAAHVQQVYVRFDAFPDHTLEAVVKEIASEASQTTRTYPVTLIMDQPVDVKIVPGMAGKTVGADIDELGGLMQGINIPVSALYTLPDSKDSYVWVINVSENTVKQRQVTVGNLTDNGILILEGLEIGEWIATAGVNYLREGQQVRILQDNKV
jgi:RND family efflux transporter MFP subunit